MEIVIFRHRYTRYGVDGILSINGRIVCATCEHPSKYLPPGTYEVVVAHNKKLRRKVPTLPNGAIIRIGNGPFKLRDGSILVGQTKAAGMVVNSAPYFNRIIDRLDKAQSRGAEITLSIQ